MDFDDASLLLETSYRGWQEMHHAYLQLARQRAAGAEVTRKDVDVARRGADRALGDFMLLCAKGAS